MGWGTPNRDVLGVGDSSKRWQLSVVEIWGEQFEKRAVANGDLDGMNRRIGRIPFMRWMGAARGVNGGQEDVEE